MTRRLFDYVGRLRWEIRIWIKVKIKVFGEGSVFFFHQPIILPTLVAEFPAAAVVGGDLEIAQAGAAVDAGPFAFDGGDGEGATGQGDGARAEAPGGAGGAHRSVFVDAHGADIEFLFVAHAMIILEAGEIGSYFLTGFTGFSGISPSGDGPLGMN